MKTLIQKIVLAAALLAITLPAKSQERSTHYQKAIELSAMIQKDTYPLLISAAIESQVRALPPEQQPGFRLAMTEFLSKYLTWEILSDAYARIYLSIFTESELADLLTFYRTPTGMKMISRTPEIMQLGSAAGQRLMMERQAEFTAILRKHLNLPKTGN